MSSSSCSADLLASSADASNLPPSYSSATTTANTNENVAHSEYSQMNLSVLHKWIVDNEVDRNTGHHLLSVLPRIKIALLVDDSGSMTSRIVEPAQNVQASNQINLFASSANVKTRWMEAQQAAVTLVNMITAMNGHLGFDVWFVNRGCVTNVSKVSDLESWFAAPPSGSTNLCSVLKRMFYTYQQLCDANQHVLVLALSDGEPTDGTMNDLIDTLTNKPRTMHVSFIECNDNEEEMAFMDSLDGKIFNFHNSDDYRDELIRVRQQQGPSFRYTYTDYIISAVLSTFVPAYFLLDQQKTARVSIQPLPELAPHELDAIESHLQFAVRNARVSGAVINPAGSMTATAPPPTFFPQPQQPTMNFAASATPYVPPSMKQQLPQDQPIQQCCTIQ